MKRLLTACVALIACAALVTLVYEGISRAAHSPRTPTPNDEQLVHSVSALYNYLWVNDSAALDHYFPSLLGCQQLGQWLACHYRITHVDGCTSGEPVTTFKRSTALYNLAMSSNRGLDRDKDGIPCETSSRSSEA
jgi:excalibur calcium-binding domain-containing protein